MDWLRDSRVALWERKMWRIRPRIEDGVDGQSIEYITYIPGATGEIVGARKTCQNVFEQKTIYGGSARNGSFVSIQLTE